MAFGHCHRISVRRKLQCASAFSVMLCFPIFTTSCSSVSWSSEVTCPIGNVVLRVPKKDLIFFSCDKNKIGYSLLTIGYRNDYRVMIQSYKAKFSEDWRSNPLGKERLGEDGLFPANCTDRYSYGCTTYITRYRIPFMMEWRYYDILREEQKAAFVAEAASYLNKRLIKGDGAAGDGRRP